MAFTSVITHRSLIGDLICNYGTYTSDGDSTGGNVNTGMDRCLFIKLQKTGNAVSTNIPVANATFPCDGKVVPIVTDANEVGIWMAIGEGMG